MDNLQVLKDQYQKEIDKLKQQINTNKPVCPLLQDRLKSYVSGWLALSRLDMLNDVDQQKADYKSVVLYNKDRAKIINSKLL